MAKREQILVGLDIGTTKICAIVSEVTEEGALNIIGVGSSPSRGLRKGVVVDIESTVESIKKAVEEAELMAAVQINSVYTGIAGSHISAENCKGVVALKKSEVTRDDIHRAIESARTLAVIPHERRILHVSWAKNAGAAQILRRADRADRLPAQFADDRILRRFDDARADCEADLVPDEIDLIVVHVELKGDVGMALVELTDAGNDPSHHNR